LLKNTTNHFDRKTDMGLQTLELNTNIWQEHNELY